MAARAKSVQERISDFLERALQKGKDDRDEVETALLRAADRYDRYALRKQEWFSYRRRRRNLTKISKGSNAVAAFLTELDIMSRDDLEARLGRERVMAIIGDLQALAREVDDLASELQEDGKPRDLEEEKWIWEVADIYENAFGKMASDWVSVSGRRSKRKPFYALLKECQSDSHPRCGKLHPKQVKAILKRRSEKFPPKIISVG